MQIFAIARTSAFRSLHRRSRGQAMTEYIVVVAAGIILLVAIVAGSSTSPVQQMIVALKGFWTHYSYLVSLP